MSSRSVLVVDDQPDFCRLLARLLQRAGYEAAWRTSGAEALEYLKTAVPNLIILDMMMPEIDGFEVLEKIRADVRLAAVPVVMFSAISDPAVRQRALTAGANDWWLKANVDFQALPRQLERYMTPA